ncbi:hypothetical protein NDU88_001867 [Pleurodeles waltl]|uniref:Uncharacterized protein n=1 Tax=Pleurodeles waltl TaxID=8319 RepID=A0AAV7Q7B3_PLEWA|nr:hypothetical protein NDU88_001867 [Pleurodeles waltl]
MKDCSVRVAQRLPSPAPVLPEPRSHPSRVLTRYRSCTRTQVRKDGTRSSTGSTRSAPSPELRSTESATAPAPAEHTCICETGLWRRGRAECLARLVYQHGVTTTPHVSDGIYIVERFC